MKLRHSGYIVITAALAIALVSCGKKEDTTETPAATTAPAGAPVDAATAGTITGTIKLDGAAPRPAKSAWLRKHIAQRSTQLRFRLKMLSSAPVERWRTRSSIFPTT